MLATDVAHRDPASWSDLPTAILRAELARRQDEATKPTCGTGGNRGTYNTSLHVGALVLILVLSTAGMCYLLVRSQLALTRLQHVLSPL